MPEGKIGSYCLSPPIIFINFQPSDYPLPNMDCTLTKAERLRGDGNFRNLAVRGRSVQAGCLRTRWLVVKEPWRPVVSAGVSVSKKKLKRAVDRNLYKRMVRETFRLNKKELAEYARKSNVKFMLLFIFTGDSLPSFDEIQSKMILTLQRIALAHEESAQ